MSAYRTTGNGIEWWLWEMNVEPVSQGGQRNGIADSRMLAMAASFNTFCVTSKINSHF